MDRIFNRIIPFVLFILLLGFPRIDSAQELNVGVPQIEGSSNIISGRDPFSDFIRRSVSRTLISSEGESGFSLQLADSASLSGGGRTMNLRLRPATTFVNGQLAGSDDIRASLQYCQANQNKKDSVSFNIEDKKGRLLIAVTAGSGKEVIEFLSGCQIMSADSIEIFRSEVGNYNLLIGTGPYALVTRIKNREARLERFAKSSSWAKLINIRSLRDSDQGLTALRTGTLDLFYTQDDAVLSKAAEDSTLLIVECGVYKVVHRTGLIFSCQPRLVPENIRYSSD